MVEERREFIFDETDVIAQPTYWVPWLLKRTPRRGSSYRLDLESDDPTTVLTRANYLGLSVSGVPAQSKQGDIPYLTLRKEGMVARMTSEREKRVHERSREYQGTDFLTALQRARELGYEPSDFGRLRPDGYGFTDWCGVMGLEGPHKAGIWFEPNGEGTTIALRVEPWTEEYTVYRLWVKE